VLDLEFADPEYCIYLKKKKDPSFRKYLFICSSFNDIFSSSEYIASNERMISE
jgi:hypothetical protein